MDSAVTWNLTSGSSVASRSRCRQARSKPSGSRVTAGAVRPGARSSCRRFIGSRQSQARARFRNEAEPHERQGAQQRASRTDSLYAVVVDDTALARFLRPLPASSAGQSPGTAAAWRSAAVSGRSTTKKLSCRWGRRPVPASPHTTAFAVWTLAEVALNFVAPSPILKTKSRRRLCWHH